MNADKIRNSVTHSTSLSVKVMSIVRCPRLEKMEKMLRLWMEDQNQKMMPMNNTIVRSKALQLYERLQQEEGGALTLKPFLASRGWFDNFRKQQKLQHIKFTGEADNGAACRFPDKFKTIVEVDGYKSQQVFIAMETDLIWKHLPKTMNTLKEENTKPVFSSAKDRLTLLLCGNAEGDFKCKPLLVYYARNPRALNRLIQHTLPMHL